MTIKQPLAQADLAPGHSILEGSMPGDARSHVVADTAETALCGAPTSQTTASVAGCLPCISAHQEGEQ